MNFLTTNTVQSEALPGVSFTVRCLNYVGRGARDLALMDDRLELSRLMEQLRELSEPVDPNKPQEPLRPRPGCELEWTKLSHRQRILNETKIIPAYIRSGLVSIDGFLVNGETATVDDVLNAAPDALLTEIFGACFAASDLPEDQRKNWQSPGTSDAPEAGPVTPTIASGVSG